MWPALFLTSNHSHIRQLQFATQAFSQKVLQQAVQISICQCSSHAMASSVIYYSAEAQKNEIYLFYIIIKLAKIIGRAAK